MPHFECGAFNHSATSPQTEVGVECAVFSGRAVPKQGRD
jgi:hypothetical protein